MNEKPAPVRFARHPTCARRCNRRAARVPTSFDLFSLEISCCHVESILADGKKCLPVRRGERQRLHAESGYVFGAGVSDLNITGSSIWRDRASGKCGR